VHLSQLIEFIGHFMGAVLQLILIMMMARRREKEQNEKVFFSLVVVIFIWHAGNFVTTFSELLTGQRVIIVGLVWDTAATLSMGFVPPLLIHALLGFLEKAPRNFFSRWRYAVLFAAYAPLPFFWSTPLRLIKHPELPRAENLLLVTQMFHYWVIVALAAASYMCYVLSKISRDDIQRRFYVSLMRMLVSILALMALTHVFYFKSIPVLGAYFLAACALAPMFPAIIFSYFILRYNYMEYVLKRSLFYAFASIFVVGVYVLVIRRIGDFVEQVVNIDFRIVEAILVIGLIMLIEPLREKFQAIFNLLFFPERRYYHLVFTELSQRLSSLQGIEVGRLLRYVANSVQAAMRLTNCRIVLFRPEGDRFAVDEASSPLPSNEIDAITRYFRNTHSRSVSLWQAPDPALVREMKALDAALVLPIYRDGHLAGILSLGESTQYRDLYEGEIEMLSILLNHLITATANTRLMRDKLEMERRMLASEKWMSLGRLSGQIAHEVKNPLSSIKAITHVMREELAPDTQFHKDLSIVEDEIDKLTGVVNQLLHKARSTSQEERMADLRDVVESITGVLRTEASQNKIAIFTDFAQGLPRIKADPVSLREIIFNLMHNGLQSMTVQSVSDRPVTDQPVASGGHLHVSVTYPAPGTGDGPPSVLVTVRDTGPGIPAEAFPKIFEPFYTTKEGGTGLGLWIVREKVAEMGGQISVESDGGTTVKVTIPVEPRTAESLAVSETKREEGNACPDDPSC
jgi:signal transduction histidine kinase